MRLFKCQQGPNKANKRAFDTNLLRPMHDSLCAYLNVEWIESEKDWDISVKRDYQNRNGDKSEETIPGMRFIFSRNGKRYGVRLDPITKRITRQPDRFERFIGVRPHIYNVIDNAEMIEELKRVIDEQVS